MDSYFLTSVIAFLLTIPMAVMVYINGPKKLLNRVYTLFLLSLSFWVFGDFFYYTPIIDFQEPKVWVQLAHIGAVLAPTFLMHFIFIFTESKVSKPLIYGLYLFSFVLEYFNLSGSPLFLKSVVVEKLGEITIDVGGMYAAFLLYTVAVLFIGFAFVYIKYRKSDGAIKQQMKYYLVASSSIILSGLVYAFSITLGFSLRIDNLLLILYAGLVAFTISKSELFDISFVISRLSSTVLVVLIFMLVYFLSSPFLNMIEYGNGIATICCVWLALQWGSTIREKIQTGIDLKFVKDFYNSEEVVQVISDNLSDIHERRKVFVTISEGLKNVVQVRHTFFIIAELLPSGEVESYSLSKEGGIEMETVRKDSDVVNYFSEKKSPLLIHRLPASIREFLLDHGISKFGVAIPLYSPPINTLEGIIFIGRRESEAPYSSKDMALFQTISNYGRMALGTIRPFEQIEQDLLYKERSNQTSRQLEQFAQGIQDYNHLHNHKLQVILNQASRILSSKNCDDYDISPDSFKELLEKNAERVDKILYATEESIKLVADSLKLAGQREKKVDLVNLDVNDFFRKFVEGQQCQLEATVSLSLELCDGAPQIICDQNDFNVIFENLLSNAIKAIDNKGSIKIKTSVKYRELLIEFVDDGSGIPDDMKEKMFNMYVSSDLSKGTGLGLTTVHRLVIDHQGRINVQTKEGQGTNFSIRFPLISVE